MKRLFFLTLLFMVSVASASAANVENYIQAQQQMLQAQVDQLQISILLLNSERLSDQDKFERIGQASFAAIDQALKQTGFSVLTFYDFKSKNEDAIREWLINHDTQASLIDSLQAERDRLMSEYDQVMQATTDAN